MPEIRRADGRTFMSAFPGMLHIIQGDGVLVLSIQPLDAGVGECWEIEINASALGHLALGESVITPVLVYGGLERSDAP